MFAADADCRHSAVRTSAVPQPLVATQVSARSADG
jgi:hypothetical protein